MREYLITFLGYIFTWTVLDYLNLHLHMNLFSVYFIEIERIEIGNV